MSRVKKVIIGITVILVVGLLSIENIGGISKVNALVGEKNPVFRVNKEEKQVSFTFDINWAENEYLYNILDILNKNNVKATFFIMGGWVNYTPENKEKLIKIKEGGHEIGNHSYIHPSFTKISNGRILEELKKTDDIIYDTVGVKPQLFRFPSGDYNEKSLEFVNSLGYTCIQWDVDSVDYKQAGADIEYQRVIKKVKPGSIMLFHNNAKYTPENLEKIILKLKEDGYEFVTVSELIYKDNYIIDDNGEQREK